MLKRVGVVCAALVVAAAAFSTSVEARSGGHGGVRAGGFGGGGARMGGANFGGARIGAGNFGGARMGGDYMGGARIGSARVGRATVGGRYGINRAAGIYGGAGLARNAGIYHGGRWAGRYGGYYGHRRYGGYWPWLGVGAGLALAATWPYYGGYGYDDCVQWRPDWGWVNVCGYPYCGYYTPTDDESYDVALRSHQRGGPSYMASLG